MEDRTIIIILATINIMMWWFSIDFMIKTRHYIADTDKRSKEYLLKNANYWHATFKNFGEMSEMNMSAMKHFLEQITDIMGYEGKNAAENRK